MEKSPGSALRKLGKNPCNRRLFRRRLIGSVPISLLLFTLCCFAEASAPIPFGSFAGENFSNDPPPPPPQSQEAPILTESMSTSEKEIFSDNPLFLVEKRGLSEEPGLVDAKEAEPGSIEDLQKTVYELKADLETIQTDLKKKQNAPDPNKKFTSQIGGFLEMDAVTVDQSQENQELYGDINNDFNVRDLRLWAKGEGYGNLSYEVALGFSGTLSFKNVMLTAKEMPILGDTRVGYFKVESGLSFLQNVYNNTFVDWEPSETFNVGRRIGLASIHYTENKNVRLFAGIFTGQNLQIGDSKHSNENNDNPGIILNTRLTGLPIYRETENGDLDTVVHLGTGFRWVDPGRDSETGKNRKTTLKASPIDWIADMPELLIGSVQTDSYTVTNIEAAFQKGRLGLVSEGHIGTYRGYDNAYGVTATGRYLLTPNAYQKYNKENGCFGGISIPENLRFVDYERHTVLEGFGVWELAGQWAWTDLDMLKESADTNTYYGRMNQYTFALNWYWNPQTRWGINWIYAEPISGTGNIPESATSLNTLALQSRITF